MIQMYKEETEKGGYRVWLQAEDREQLLNHYDDYEKELAIKLMLKCGLRVGEVNRVSAGHIKDSDADFSLLEVPEAKRGYREAFIPSDLATQIKSIYKVRDDVYQHDPVVTVTTRSIQNWVKEAGKELAEETGDEDWTHLSAHDLRRTWATNLIQSGLVGDVVMDWGGWNDYQTFRDHYWRADDEKIQSNLQEAGML